MSEAAIRLVAFLSIFAAMAAFELWSPRLERDEMRGALKSRRWLTNLTMVVLSSVLVRILFPAAAVGTALWAEHQGYGLFRQAGMDPVLAGLLGFVILDLAVWLEHLASHKIPILWRIHRMHHADQGFDLTTALRFHPLEIVLSMLWKAAIVVALGLPVMAVLVFEIVLNGMAMFNHANARLPLGLDKVLRLFVVTPDMHRVHHSSIPSETDSNYGFNFPFWDRIFRTYNDQPRLGHDGMEIGLREFRDGSSANLVWSLVLPFRGSGPAASGQKKLTGK
ncbi:sterol desaturase family protein [Aquibium carbonis]|uniref:Sterol desaturase family protein n=1 Tax=Aquibium carbonis TaxID=2495581 RepID=A0A3S0G9P8_9HYPH|nr:sterol desaturase family protein [Aquibium carbonis]RST86899.1 sterol desaturase family protein [Aquibium carbonis]